MKISSKMSSAERAAATLGAVPTSPSPAPWGSPEEGSPKGWEPSPRARCFAPKIFWDYTQSKGAIRELAKSSTSRLSHPSAFASCALWDV